MKRIAVVVLIAALGACTETEQPATRDATLSTCAELGCRWAASGAPDRWTPCTESVCWCDDLSTREVPRPTIQCTRIPCGNGPQLCAAGLHAEHAEYTGGSVCYCMPDE